MNPGTPVSTTVLNLTRNLIPSLICRIAVSGRVETSKFSLIRLGVFEVVRRAVPRWIAQASKTWAGVLLTRLAIAMMTGSSTNLGSSAASGRRAYLSSQVFQRARLYSTGWMLKPFTPARAAMISLVVYTGIHTISLARMSCTPP